MFGKKKAKKSGKRSLEEMFVDEKVIENHEDAVCEGEKETSSLATEKAKKPPEVPFNVFTCFGWEEGKTDKWLIKCANAWYMIISFIWFLLGALTFAPVIFISNKISAVFDDRKQSFVFAFGIYFALCFLFIFLFVIK